MPTQSPYSLGWRKTGKRRIRTGFLGFAVIEELYEHVDETRLWRRIQTSWRIPEETKERVSPGTTASGVRPRTGSGVKTREDR